MILSASEISEAVEQRVGRFRAKPPDLMRLDNNQELETKLEVLSVEQVNRIISVLEELGIAGYEHRSEIHEVSFDGYQFGYRIYVRGLNETWIKLKSKGAEQTTRRLGIPLLTREGRKFRPGQLGYESAFNQVANMKPIGRFSKECHNIFFRFEGHVFSLSLSLADGGASFHDYKLEFEYEGNHSEIPSVEGVMKLFDDLFEERLPDIVQGLSTQTKGDILARRPEAR